MDEKKPEMDSRDKRIREIILLENDWYTCLGKYHFSKRVVDAVFGYAKNYGCAALRGCDIPLYCKERIPNKNELKKLLSSVKEQMSILARGDFDVNLTKHKRRDGIIIYLITLAPKPEEPETGGLTAVFD